MPNTYDPTAAAVTVDATITVNSVDINYIVTAFNDSGASPVGPDLSASDGSYRGARRVKGAREASMTIEIENGVQPIPPQFTEFEYDDHNWVIFQPAKAVSSTGAGSYTLSLRCTDIPGTLVSVAVTAGGSSYETAPTVTFTGGGGVGAAATAVLTADAVTSITVTNPGRGYTTAPTVGFTGGGGTGATATATIYTEL